MAKSKKTTELTKSASAELAKSIPAWVGEKEDIGTSMYEAGQEMLLAVDDILMKHYGFNEDEIKSFHAKLELVLMGVAEFEKYGFSLLSPHSVSAISNLVETRLMKNKMARAGLEYPFLPGAEQYIKQIQSPEGKKTKAIKA